MKTKKKGLHPDSVRWCAQTLCPSYKGGRGAMPQFCILFYANFTILATRRGDSAPCPLLNTPLIATTSVQKEKNIVSKTVDFFTHFARIKFSGQKLKTTECFQRRSKKCTQINMQKANKITNHLLINFY